VKIKSVINDDVVSILTLYALTFIIGKLRMNVLDLEIYQDISILEIG
jgi:hypothetical protein